MKTNKLEQFRALELMCKVLIGIIELHRNGIEPYDSVLTRCLYLKDYINHLTGEKLK